MSTQARTTTPVLLPEDDLIPLALIAVEVGESVDRIAHRFGEAVPLDDVGMRAVSASVAREFFTERAEWKARRDEEARRRHEELAKKYPITPAGVPAVEGADSGVEALMLSGNWVSPTDEFGLPRPNFLEEQLAEGQRDLARRRAEARAKGQAVDKMKEDLQ